MLAHAIARLTRGGSIHRSSNDVYGRRCGPIGHLILLSKQPEAPDWPSLTDMDLRASENSPMMFPRSLTSAIRFSGFMVRDDSRTLSL